MGRVASFVIVIAIVVGLKFARKSSDSGEIKQQMFELVQEMPSFKLNGGYITELFNAKYDAAFEEAYQMGGRRSSAEFDDTQFIEKLFDSMYSQAQTDGKEDVAKDIASLKVNLVKLMRMSESMQ